MSDEASKKYRAEWVDGAPPDGRVGDEWQRGDGVTFRRIEGGWTQVVADEPTD